MLYLNNKCIDISLVLWKHSVNLLFCINIITTDEDPSLRIESFAIINLRVMFPQNYTDVDVHHVTIKRTSYIQNILYLENVKPSQS